FLARGRFFRPGVRIPVAETADAADRRHALLVSVETAIVAAVAIGRAPGGFLGGRGSDKHEHSRGDQTAKNKNSHRVSLQNQPLPLPPPPPPMPPPGLRFRPPGKLGLRPGPDFTF